MSNYRIQETLLEHSERSLYHALSLVVAQRALILTKVKLSAILAPTAALGQQIAATRLDRYTVDFVLCDRQTTRPLLVIQQEEASSKSGAANNVNDLIERMSSSCGLPMIRLSTQSAYRMDLLLRLIEPYLVDDKRGSDYAAGDRMTMDANTIDANTIEVNTAGANLIDAKKPPVPRPATLFSTN